MKGVKRSLWAFGITFCTFGMLSEHVRVLRSLTPSLPYTYFLHFPKISPSKGHMTTFFHASSQKLLIKQILGGEGDVIVVNAGSIYL
jgi:hypothetical protein